MTLRGRLVVGALAVIAVQVIVVVLLVQRQLSTSLRENAIADLTREARVVAAQWTPDADPSAIAHRNGVALGRRVTLVAPGGVVVGDSEFEPDALAGLENHANRPEILAANSGQVGTNTRRSASRSDDELYVAVKAERGVSRVSMSEYWLNAAIARAQNVVRLAGVVSLVVALLIASMLAQRLARPVIELKDVATAIAAGDLTRRASIEPGGELGALALSLRDLSEQLAAREQSRQAYEGLLEQLTESLNEGIVGVDASRQVVRINNTARRLLGVPDALPFSVDLIPRDRALRDALESAYQGNTTEGSESMLQGRTVHVTARPLSAGGAVLALLDMTRVRRLEAVRRDFVANVSHELRTPLTIVSGFAETLVTDDLDPVSRAQFAKRILVSTHRMQRIVDDLLDLSRIESGTWIPNVEDVNMELIAADAFANARDAAAAKGVRLETDIAADARIVRADATAIRQIAGNLVDNAVRHTPSGSVTVFARRVPSGALELGVRDTGTGISAEHLPRIFERFYRADTARSRDHGGTGLGLAIVRLLVEAHGGRVSAQSSVGHGTTVTAEFPIQVREGV